MLIYKKTWPREVYYFLKKYNSVLNATGITATAGKGYAKKQQRSASQLFKLLCDKRNGLWYYESDISEYDFCRNESIFKFYLKIYLF